MRLLLRTATAVGLLLLAGLGLASASELVGSPRTGPAILPVTPPTPISPILKKPVEKCDLDKCSTGTCGKYGTTIEFVDTPHEAATQAKKEGKLVFVLHVSGHLEDPRFL